MEPFFNLSGVVALAFASTNMDNLLLLVSWLLVPVLGIYALSLRQPIFTDRYVIWIAPALMLLAALGATTVWRYAWRLGPLLGSYIERTFINGGRIGNLFEARYSPRGHGILPISSNRHRQIRYSYY